MKSMILSLVALMIGPTVTVAEEAEKTILEAAVSAKLTTLVAAVKAGGLVETLSGEGPLTLFAPTDKAFEKLPNGTLEKLLTDEGKAPLVAILKYHVVDRSVPASAVAQLESAETLQGREIQIEVTDDGVVLNGKSKVIKSDVKCRNGIIHVVDRVLVPPTQE